MLIRVNTFDNDISIILDPLGLIHGKKQKNIFLEEGFIKLIDIKRYQFFRTERFIYVRKNQDEKMSYCKNRNLRSDLGGMDMRNDMIIVGQWADLFVKSPPSTCIETSQITVSWGHVHRRSQRKNQIIRWHESLPMQNNLCWPDEVNAERRFNEPRR